MTRMAEDPRISVVAEVRAAILQGEFAPNQRLIETDLCERFSTSRFVARAALQELSAQGLVEFQRNRGARVRDISLDEAIEITEVRKLLEGLEAARAADRITRAQAADLRAIVRSRRPSRSATATSTPGCTRRSATSRPITPRRGCCSSSETRRCGTGSRCRWFPDDPWCRCRSMRPSSPP
jgi:DNA-binding GntR family transcriptional regulator